MKWEHKFTGFIFDTVAELNEKLEKWSDEGWEAVSTQGEYEKEAGEQFRVYILFKRMKPIELTGEID